MSYQDAGARALLDDMQSQPEAIREIMLYAICQTMVQAGLLLFVGAFSTPGVGTTLIYKNPDTGEIVEIVKPQMTEDEEREMRAHIGKLLEEEAARAA